MKTDYSIRLITTFATFERIAPVADPQLVGIKFNELIAIVSQAMCRSVQPNIYNQMWTKLYQEARPILFELESGQPEARKQLYEKVKEACSSLRQ